MFTRIGMLIYCCVFFACIKPSPGLQYDGQTTLLVPVQQKLDSLLASAKNSITKLMDHKHKVLKAESSFINSGLVNVKKEIPSILIDLRYTGTDNFMHIDVYGDIENAYLQPDVAAKLAIAQATLKSPHPDYSLIVFDAARPLSVQKLMWDTIQVPKWEKIKYLSNPQFGSLHNYAAAVDVGIADGNGKELDMGTAYDFFGELAYPEKEGEMAALGKLTKAQLENRYLLRAVMYKAGFYNIQTEWWHFNSCRLDVATRQYKIIP